MFVKLCVTLFIFLSSLMFPAQGQGGVEAKKEPSGIAKFMSLLKAKRCNIQKTISSISSIKTMLEQPAADMSPALVSKVLTTLTCAKSKHTQHNHILTVIDYSKPSNTKRLWVFDINKNMGVLNVWFQCRFEVYEAVWFALDLRLRLHFLDLLFPSC